MRTDVSSIVEVPVNKITMRIYVRADDWAVKKAIVASDAVQ